MNFSILILLLISSAWASPPPSFSVDSANKAVFMDFIEATYNITYDVAANTATSSAVIKFTLDGPGYPLFDLLPEASAIQIDGLPTTAVYQESPDHYTRYRRVALPVSAGAHTLSVTNEISLLRWTGSIAVNSGFFVSDLHGTFLEKYIPTSLEWDAHKITFNVKVINTETIHLIYVNTTDVQKTGKNAWSISFPSYFSTSSPYFHLVPENELAEKHFRLELANGKSIPAVVYGEITSGDDLELKRMIANLEKELGPWPHPSLTVYYGDPGSGVGGMEYCGATVTKKRYILHELTHSYFGRAVMPVNGDAGWLDEALTSWYSNQPSTSRTATTFKEGDYFTSPYYRATSPDSYYKGANFIAYLNHRHIDADKDFVSFLKSFVADNLFNRIDTEDFRSGLEKSLGAGLENEFREAGLAPWPRNNLFPQMKSEANHPIHKKLTNEQLKNLM